MNSEMLATALYATSGSYQSRFVHGQRPGSSSTSVSADGSFRPIKSRSKEDGNCQQNSGRDNHAVDPKCGTCCSANETAQDLTDTQQGRIRAHDHAAVARVQLGDVRKQSKGRRRSS